MLYVHQGQFNIVLVEIGSQKNNHSVFFFLSPASFSIWFFIWPFVSDKQCSFLLESLWKLTSKLSNLSRNTVYSELLAFYKKSNLNIIGLIFDKKSKQLFYHRYFVTAYVRSWLIRMYWLTQLDHLLLRGSIPGTLTGIRMEWCSFGVSFLPRGGGELFSFGNDFARPRGRTQRICSRQWDKRGEKCFDDRCVKMQKHWMRLFVIFSNEK